MNRCIVLLQPGAPPKKVYIGEDEDDVLEACKRVFGASNFTEHIPLCAAEKFGFKLGIFIRDPPSPEDQEEENLKGSGNETMTTKLEQHNALASKIAVHLYRHAFISSRYKDIRGPAVLYDDEKSVDETVWAVVNKIIRAKQQRAPPPEIVKYWSTHPLFLTPSSLQNNTDSSLSTTSTATKNNKNSAELLEWMKTMRDCELNRYGEEIY
jgi:hypothetical protein